MRTRRGQVSIALVTLFLGALVVLQLRGQANVSGLDTLSVQELTVLVGNLATRNQQLRTEVAVLNSEATRLGGAQLRGETSLGQLQNDLARVRTWSGLDAVQGRGVRVTVAGPIDAFAVGDLLNELRNAGAEAMALSGVRVATGSVVSAGPQADLQIDGRPFESPFTIDVIGDPDVLSGALTRIGGVVTQLAATFPDTSVSVTAVDRLLLPASTRSLAPVLGRPNG